MCCPRLGQAAPWLWVRSKTLLLASLSKSGSYMNVFLCLCTCTCGCMFARLCGCVLVYLHLCVCTMCMCTLVLWCCFVLVRFGLCVCWVCMRTFAWWCVCLYLVFVNYQFAWLRVWGLCVNTKLCWLAATTVLLYASESSARTVGPTGCLTTSSMWWFEFSKPLGSFASPTAEIRQSVFMSRKNSSWSVACLHVRVAACLSVCTCVVARCVCARLCYGVASYLFDWTCVFVGCICARLHDGVFAWVWCFFIINLRGCVFEETHYAAEWSHPRIAVPAAGNLQLFGICVRKLKW